MVTILNTSIITAFGSFSYEKIGLGRAKLLTTGGFQSAIGHESTAQIISELLTLDCKVNRVNYQQDIGEKALVFKLKARAPEGVILTREQIEEIGYEWGLLERLS